MSEGFTADWLSLREPYDALACEPRLLARLGDWSRNRPSLRVVDLGAGAGSNLRRTAAHLAVPQSWTLLEWDQALIAAGERQLAAVPEAWSYRRLDLARELERVADEPCDLVTASALLDLASAEWVACLETVRRRLGAALYITLSYVGGVRWSPADPFDATALELVDRHQRTDKGFGPALGPSAVSVLRACLPSASVWVGASPWRLGSEDQGIQRMLLDGYVAAAAAIAPELGTDLRLWSQRRRSLLDQGRSALEVPHQDLLFLPHQPRTVSGRGPLPG